MNKFVQAVVAMAAVIFIFSAFIVDEVAPIVVNTESELKGASPNMQARLLSNATTTVGHQTDRTLATEKEYCASRVVSTLGLPIYLSFKSSTLNPAAARGHVQSASTTVAYDSAVYGCGAIVAAASATTTVAVAEFIY
jgi:hypothetical protein